MPTEQVILNIRDVVDTMSKTQKDAMYTLIEKAIEDIKHELDIQSPSKVMRDMYVHENERRETEKMGPSTNDIFDASLYAKSTDGTYLTVNVPRGNGRTFVGSIMRNMILDNTYILAWEPKEIIKNNNALIVIWRGGSKTIVKRKPDDPDDIYSAFAQAYMKRLCGSTTHFHKWLDRHIKIQEPKKKAVD